MQSLLVISAKAKMICAITLTIHDFEHNLW